MSYPLINGATINGFEAGQTEGIELVTAGLATASHDVYPAGALPLEIGDIDARFSIGPDGIDLVQTETHTAIYSGIVLPAGIELVTAGVATVHVVVVAVGARPLEIGAPRARNGVDVEARPAGLDLVRSGLHSAFLAQPAPAMTVEAAGTRPLQMGVPGAHLGSVTVDAPGYHALEMGDPATGVAAQAVGHAAMEFGQPSTGIVVIGRGGVALDMGAPALRFRISVTGFDFGISGKHSALVAPTEVFASGAHPMEFGNPLAPTVVVFGRQSFPMQLGQPSLDRGATC